MRIKIYCFFTHFYPLIFIQLLNIGLPSCILFIAAYKLVINLFYYIFNIALAEV